MYLAIVKKFFPKWSHLGWDATLKILCRMSYFQQSWVPTWSFMFDILHIKLFHFRLKFVLKGDSQ